MAKGDGKNPVKLGVRSPMHGYEVGGGSVPKVGDNTIKRSGKPVKLVSPAR